MVHYYPDPSGQGGYVFVDGLIGPSYTEFDGKWYPDSAKGDATMRRLLTEHGITLPAPPALPATGSDPRTALWLTLLAVTLAGLGGLLRLLHTRHR